MKKYANLYTTVIGWFDPGYNAPETNMLTLKDNKNGVKVNIFVSGSLDPGSNQTITVV
jgi:hypothetical protein